MAKMCQTRALKNAKYLQKAGVGAFSETEPLEGFANLIPNEFLMKLAKANPDQIDLPSVKELVREGGVPEARGEVTGPLFSGTVFPVQVSFSAPGGPFAVSEEDLRTVTEFLSLAARPISRYVSQYGANVLAVSHRYVQFQTLLSEPRFNDQMVSEWVDQIVAENVFSRNSCIVFLNPQGVLNVDADSSQGMLGYHSSSSTGVPYLFVNVTGRDLTVDDTNDSYAFALSHGLAEMAADPRAETTNPECCDPCGPGASLSLRSYFGVDEKYMETSPDFPPPFPYNFFISAIVRPRSVSTSPAPTQDCSYQPP